MPKPGQASADADDASPFAEPLASSVRSSKGSRAVGGGRARLLASLDHVSRLGHLAEQVGELLDIRESQALELLDRAALGTSYSPTEFEDVTVLRFVGGRRVASAITSFVRVVGGSSFPTHSHLGRETVLVLQGSIVVEETGAILRSGDTLVSDRPHEHAIVARPGPDLVYLVVIEGGIRVGERTYTP